MGRYILFLIPHLWFHEGGHFLAALLCGHRLHFYYSEGHLGPLTIPRYCWRMPWGLAEWQETLIYRAGFLAEALAGLVVLCFSLRWGLCYLAGFVLHRVLYTHYGGNPREIGR